MIYIYIYIFNKTIYLFALSNNFIKKKRNILHIHVEKRARKKVDRLNAANSEELRELDFSDSEDPFMADDDSDDYKEETDDDSDWEDSQQAEEDSENIKRLVKEAEKFVQK